MKVPLSQIVLDPNNQRKHTDLEAFSELKASIYAIGLQVPVIVREVRVPGQETQYQLLSGERRCKALIELGHKKVDVVVKEIKDDVELLVFAAVSNSGQLDLVLRDKYDLIRALTGSGKAVAEVASILVCSAQTIRDYLNLGRLDPKIFEYLDPKLPREAGLSLGPAVELSREEQSVQLDTLSLILEAGVKVGDITKQQMKSVVTSVRSSRKLSPQISKGGKVANLVVVNTFKLFLTRLGKEVFVIGSKGEDHLRLLLKPYTYLSVQGFIVTLQGIQLGLGTMVTWLEKIRTEKEEEFRKGP